MLDKSNKVWYNKGTKRKEIKTMTFREMKEQAIRRLWEALEACEMMGISLVDVRDGRVEDSMNLTYKED